MALALLLVFTGGYAFGVNSVKKKEIAEVPAGALFAAGTYETEAAGYGGEGNPIKLKVTFSDQEIESIEYTADGETPTVGGMALPKLVDAALAAQSPDIDLTSGATITYNGFIAALNDAIVLAGADPSKLVAKKTEKTIENVE